MKPREAAGESSSTRRFGCVELSMFVGRARQEAWCLADMRQAPPAEMSHIVHTVPGPVPETRNQLSLVFRRRSSADVGC